MPSPARGTSAARIRKLFEQAIAKDKDFALGYIGLVNYNRVTIAAVAEDTGLPADDPVRFGAHDLLDALLARL